MSGSCEHEWSDRGSPGYYWRECWLCGEQTSYTTYRIPPAQRDDGEATR